MGEHEGSGPVRAGGAPAGRRSWCARALHAGFAIALGASWSCGELVTQGRSPSYIIIDQLVARRGTETEFSNVLLSDVVTEGTAFEDVGRVTARLGFRDPGTPQTPTTPTSANFITVTRYRVEFKRSDGRNTPGVDVPYPFDGAITFTIGTGTTEAGFSIVRAQSKLEPPLLALRERPMVISTIAEVTFFGDDQTGAGVSTTGSISVNFADWGDSD